ncbi:myosin-G heavy chain-like [Sabethes cyaneus]|uniref:myosin-G heavy chain-like n=1 Tax=Sabethes cyaneus TaxID=53552 RepID=UPI00237DD248|nr:myosin-G heavy chain-like [Sabethes cyaneus]
MERNKNHSFSFFSAGDEEPLLLSPSSSTSCCSSSSPLSSEVSATNLVLASSSESIMASSPPDPAPMRPALVPLEIVPNTTTTGTSISNIGTTTNGSSSCEPPSNLTSSDIHANNSNSNSNSNSSNNFDSRLSPHLHQQGVSQPPSPSDHSRSSFSDHSAAPEQTALPAPAVEVAKPAKVKEPLSKPNPTTPQNTTNDTTLNNGSTIASPAVPTTPLSPTTLGTADLDTELESLKSKVKVIRTGKIKQPEFLANDDFKLPTFKFLPKSISLCNDDSVFKENYTKFCDRNAIQKPFHLQAASAASSEVTSSVTTTQQVSDGPNKLIVTKTTKSSKTSADGTKTVTIRKTIVKQKKISEEPQEEKPMLKSPQPSLDRSASIKRTKFRVNQMSSRDVPVAINSVAKRYLEQNHLIAATESTYPVPKSDQLVKKFHKDHHQQQQQQQLNVETTNNLKNTLKIRSLSVDWDAVEAVENRSMKSINTFLKRTTATSSANSAVKQIQQQLEASIHK